MNNEKLITLYKYLPFNEGSLKTLTEGTIKFTSPLEFNDPFDCKPAYCEKSLTKIFENKKELIRKIGKNRGLSPAEIIRTKRKIAKEVERHFLDDEIPKRVMSNIGVVSLSSDASNILMWSHYADFHHGFVAEFTIPLEGSPSLAWEAEHYLISLKVDYVDNRPELKYGIDTEPATLKKMIFTKSKIWNYENEHRVMDTRRGPSIHPYARDEILTGVIAGMKISDENYSTLKNIVAELKEKKALSGLTLYKAEPAKKDYKIIIPGHKNWS